MMQKATLNPTPDQTFEVEGAGAYDFAKVLARSREMERAGNVEGACNERYAAFQRLAELIPENEEVILEWNHRNSRAALELIYASAVDHFLINDFELSAALLEMLLDLDPEDHLEGSTLLAFDYVAMDEQELFDEVVNDISDKYADRTLLLLWSGFRRDGHLPEPRSGRRRASCGCAPRISGRAGPSSSRRCGADAAPEAERGPGPKVAEKCLRPGPGMVLGPGCCRAALPQGG